MADHPFDQFRAAVKHAANGDWQKLSRNPFYRACEPGMSPAANRVIGNWSGERAFYERLEALCLRLVARAIQSPTPTEALVDACRLYAQAFMGEYISAARLEKRFSGTEKDAVSPTQDHFAGYVLEQIAERVPALRSINRPELITNLRGPVSKDTFERSVRRALGRLFDAVGSELVRSDSGQRSDTPKADVAAGSPQLGPAELELWQRIGVSTRERCTRFELGGKRFPIEASMPRRGVAVGGDGQRAVDILAALQKYARVLISAPLGGGLTTLAARVAMELATQDHSRLTVYIPLAKHGREIVQHGLVHLLAHEVWGAAPAQEAAPLEHLLAKLAQHDALNLVLDGWDEMDADPRLVRDALAPFKRYVCLTHAPPAQIHPAWDGSIALLPLTSTEIGQWQHALARSGEAPFDERHLPVIFDVLARDASTELNGSAPSLLDISLELLGNDQDALATAALLWHWIDRRLANVHIAENDPLAERASTRQWLGQLALWMLWGTPTVMKHRKEPTVWQVAGSLLEPPLSAQPAPVYLAVPLARRQALAVRCGLLQERDAGTWAFTAPCIQQMLAAETLAREPGYASELTMPESRRILLFAAWVSAHSPGQAAALQSVIGSYQHPREHTHLDWMLFLAELLEQFATGRVQTAWAQTTREFLEQKLLAVWHACAFTPEQVKVGWALARIGSRQALACCIRELNEGGDLLDVERIHLIQQLRHFCGKAAADALSEVVCQRTDADSVRAEAVQALCRRPSAAALSALRELLHTGDAAQREWLHGMLNLSASPLAQYCVLGDRAASAWGMASPDSGDCDENDALECLERLPGADQEVRREITRRLSRLQTMTRPALIERALEWALHGALPVRRLGADLLSRVPPTAKAPSVLEVGTARQLLTDLDRGVDEQWAAYMLLKVGAPVAIFPDLVRRAEGGDMCRTFAARAATDILATRRYLCPVLEKRSGLDEVKLLLMLRFRFHIGVDYAIAAGGRTVFSRSDGRIYRTCSELADEISIDGGTRSSSSKNAAMRLAG